MRRTKGRVRQRAEYFLVQRFAGLLKRAKPGQIDRWSSRLAGIAQRAFRRRTRMAADNLRRTFPQKSEEECRSIVRRCWTHFARTTLEFLRTIDEPLEDLAARFDIEGWTNYQEAMGPRSGIVVITAHLGNWEFALSLISRVERRVTIVARALDNDLLEEKVLRARQRSEVEFVERRRAARALVRTLEQDGMVILVADQAVQPHEGVLVPFLGRPAWTTSSPARLSLKFGAPILCVFCRPAGERFVLEIEPPIVPDRLQESERTVESITARMNDLISAQIARDPALWLWMHNRWKGT